MDRKGFRNRLKQYKKAREENPGLKYWEWKSISKYADGGEVKNPNLLRYKLNLPSVSTEDLPIVYDEKLDLENKIKLHETVVNQFLLKKSDIVLKFNKTADLYDVPKIKDKEITLSNAGSMTGAVLSTNLLDSIYKYANITGLPLIEAVGLPAQETAFGKWRNVGGHAYYNTPNDRDTRPDIITSDWLYTKPGVLHYVDMARLNAGYNASEKESIELLWDDAKDYDRRQLLHLRDKEANLKGQADYLKSKQKDIDKIFENFKIIPPLQHAYEYYKTGNYNKGDSSHKQDVIRKGREVMNSPEFKKWAKENNIKYAEGGEVTGPPTYEQWYDDMIQYNPTILDDASLYWSLEAAKKDLHKQAMGLPGYAPMWHEYVRSLPKADPDINQFVNDLWANENPNNVGYRNGKYYPHKSPEGGKMTIGPGFKLDSGSHGISTKTANRGMTKTRLYQEARKIGKQHLKAVDQFINYGQTTNPADTVSPQIKMGLMDLRHLVGPLNEWGNLRQAVLEGDLDRIRKESTVTWNDNGKTKVDKRRKKIRDEKYFYYE